MKKDRPNILFILSDQHAFNIIGSYGNKIIRTPHLDELASNGVSFDNVYTPSPICLPARMSLLTGKYPFKQNCWTNSDSLASDIPTMAHSLGAVGYDPILIGRLHAIGPDQLHGFASRKVFDHSSDWYGGSEYTLGILDKAQRPFKESILNSGPGQMSYEVLDKEVTAETIKYLKKIGSERKNGNKKPFALQVGFMLPHQPYVANPDLFRYYKDKVGPPKLKKALSSNNDWLDSWREKTGLNEIKEEDEIRARAAYYALVETLDGLIGKIINSLKENNLFENTLIIYASDHGEQIGERDLWWKQTFYEESVKVPLIMSWKDKLPCNQRRKQILNLVDLTATIIDAGQGMALSSIDGKSFLSTAICNKNGRKNETFSEFCMDNSLSWSDTKEPHLSRMIRSNDWKFVYYHGYNNQLFNLKNDPDEMNNLSGLKEYSKIETKLINKILKNWRPLKIKKIMDSKINDKKILKAWAQSVQPLDNYKWKTKAEDNWLE